MDAREWLADWAWVPVSIAIVVVFGMFGAPLLWSLGVPPAWFALATLTLTFVVCLGPSARRDPAAFASIVGPASVLAVVALALPWPANFALDALAFGLVFAFTFAVSFVWPLWSSAVLRRPPLPSSWDFDDRLTTHAAEMSRWAERTTMDLGEREHALRIAPRRIRQLRRMRAPSADWAALRDDVADWEEAWLDRARRGAPESDDATQTAADLTARHQLLRSRGPATQGS
jgi:hypothetical protein